MMYSNYSKVLIVILFSGIYACSQNKESNGEVAKTISTDIVANPATASGSTAQTALPAFQFDEEETTKQRYNQSPI